MMRFRGRTHRSGLRLLLVDLVNRLSRGLHLGSLSTLFAYAVNSLRRAKRTFDGFTYLGLILCIVTTSYYIAKGVSGMKAAMALEKDGLSTDNSE